MITNLTWKRRLIPLIYVFMWSHVHCAEAQALGTPLTSGSDKPRYQLMQTYPYEPLSEICVPYANMLNSFSHKEPLMQCDQKLHPAYSQFKAVPMQELRGTGTFNYLNAIRDYEASLATARGEKPDPGAYKKPRELLELGGNVNGYKYYLFTTDRYIKDKTTTFLVQEKQGDCRKDKFNPQRTAYEWDAKADKVIAKRFSFQSLFIYEGETLEWPGLLYGYWNPGEWTSKPPGKSGGIWLKQADGKGASVRACSISFSNER